MSSPPPIPAASPSKVQSPNFWSRHWKWMVPGIGVALFLLLALVIGGLLSVIAATLKSRDVYRDVLCIARADARVVQALGAPVDDAFLPSGSISYTGQAGEAHLSVDLHGPRGDGNVQVDATRRHGRWSYQTLTFASGQAEPISLLPATHAPSQPCMP
ncbi:cytochrome c oxidase assembly factor 1 family protein [Xanthomonas sp. 3075]|uniref:cytochrome c oxidase assembly factor 1 family protein n=1 Tax=Xanthomonas sp. 3075 TaxID=3035315 RepID=UPI0017B1A774|nr:cytochrome c oxidase assembly factor 1 family protein [Xanthomonas sp. 3075]MBB4129775.1 hypothetical protein [Xanthomonas sp. 3075]